MDIDDLWDFDDAAGSESRFRDRLSKESDPALVAEIQTQIARTLSLRRRFDEAHALLDEISSAVSACPPKVQIRHLLERGRTYNSAGLKDQAMAQFEQAYDLAQESGEEFFGADAAHMIAIAATGEASIEWNLKTIAIAERATDPRAKKWVASATNNLGWAYYALGRYDEALVQFERAVDLRRSGSPENYNIARWCMAKCLRALDRLEEALAIQYELEAIYTANGTPDGFVQEEIAESLFAMGHAEEARPRFSRAFELLSTNEWLVNDEPERLERLQRLGAG